MVHELHLTTAELNFLRGLLNYLDAGDEEEAAGIVGSTVYHHEIRQSLNSKLWNTKRKREYWKENSKDV